MNRWVYFLVVGGIGLPLGLWDAISTGDRIAAVHSDAEVERFPICVDKTLEVGIPQSRAEEFCGCVVRESEKRGANQSYGSYDEDKLKDIVIDCGKVNGIS